MHESLSLSHAKEMCHLFGLCCCVAFHSHCMDGIRRGCILHWSEEEEAAATGVALKFN
jgi:hypothetical protein